MLPPETVAPAGMPVIVMLKVKSTYVWEADIVTVYEDGLIEMSRFSEGEGPGS